MANDYIANGLLVGAAAAVAAAIAAAAVAAAITIVLHSIPPFFGLMEQVVLMANN